MSKKIISNEELERRFDAGEDVSKYFDWDAARRPNLEIKRVNVDIPRWMVEALDRHALRLNISRQAVIKTMLDNQLHDMDKHL